MAGFEGRVDDSPCVASSQLTHNRIGLTQARKRASRAVIRAPSQPYKNMGDNPSEEDAVDGPGVCFVAAVARRFYDTTFSLGGAKGMGWTPGGIRRKSSDDTVVKLANQICSINRHLVTRRGPGQALDAPQS